MLTLIYGAGIAQGIFLIAALTRLKVKRNRARYLLVAIVGVLTSMLGVEFADDVITGLEPPQLGLAVEFAFWPMLYLFVLALHNGPDRQAKIDLPHFAPVVVALLLLFGLPLFGIVLKGPLMAAWLGAKFIWFATYSILIWREFARAESAFHVTRMAMRWLRSWFILLTILLLIIYIDAALWLAGVHGEWGTNIPRMRKCRRSFLSSI